MYIMIIYNYIYILCMNVYIHVCIFFYACTHDILPYVFCFLFKGWCSLQNQTQTTNPVAQIGRVDMYDCKGTMVLTFTLQQQKPGRPSGENHWRKPFFRKPQHHHCGCFFQLLVVCFVCGHVLTYCWSGAPL